jgi:hypothetical protein
VWGWYLWRVVPRRRVQVAARDTFKASREPIAERARLRKGAAGGRTGGRRRTGAFLRLSNQRAVPPRIRRYIVMASHIAK